MDLTQIQRAIVELPAEEQTALAAWIAERDRARWDEQIERDFSAGGAGMELLGKVREQGRDGCRDPFPKAGFVRDFSLEDPLTKTGRGLWQSRKRR